MMEYKFGAMYLNAERVDDKNYIIHLSNGKDIYVEKEPTYNEEIWAWRVGTQVFDNEQFALNYLNRLVVELLTGKRVIFHAKRKAPEICGVGGSGCRAPGECNRMLCANCPVAEKFFADRDGVELVYAVN